MAEETLDPEHQTQGDTKEGRRPHVSTARIKCSVIIRHTWVTVRHEI